MVQRRYHNPLSYQRSYIRVRSLASRGKFRKTFERFDAIFFHATSTFIDANHCYCFTQHTSFFNATQKSFDEGLGPKHQSYLDSLGLEFFVCYSISIRQYHTRQHFSLLPITSDCQYMLQQSEAQTRNISYISTRWYWIFSCVVLYLSVSTPSIRTIKMPHF